MQIVDVDFRYVMRDQHVAREGYGSGTDTVKCKVLQWRKKIVAANYPECRIDEWTDWQDVRTEEE